MPIVRILLVLFALASPALAQDGAQKTADAREAAQAFQVYIDGVAKQGGRPDLTRPDIAALLDRVFDLDALNGLPPAQGSDLPWLLDWMQAANTVGKLIIRYGSKPGPQPDFAALAINMTEYEDQYATSTNFLIRGWAREVVSIKLFAVGLKPEQWTRIREEGFVKARHGAAEFVLAAVCSAIEGNARPANVRLVAAALRDTRDIWASYFAPQDRASVVKYLTSLPKPLSDETARTDLTEFTAALQAVD